MKQIKPFLIEIHLGMDHQSRHKYDDLYKDADLAQMQSFYLWLLDKIPVPSTGNLLDVSCGTGELVRLALSKGLIAVGIDFSNIVTHRAARASSGDAAYLTAAGESLPLADESFDLVTNIGSLEHFIHPAEGIREMSRVMKRDGTAVILVPNTFSLLSNVLSVWRTGSIATDEQPIQRYGSRADWEVLLQGNGLRVQKTIKYERPYPRSWQDLMYYLRKPKELLRVVLTPFIPTNLAYAFLFICKVIEDRE
jgi:SAM-dependent methyltransferase